MGILDRFRTSAPPRKPQGRSGRGHTSGILRLEELNAELTGIRGLEIFDRMWRTDGDVRRSLAMVCNPVIGGTWTVEPFGGDDAGDRERKHAEFAQWAMWEFMRPNLPEHLAEALPLFTRSGFAPFEQVWQATEYEGKQVVVPRKLDVRLPRSIYEFHQDDYGELEWLRQLLPEGGWVKLDARNLVYYRVGAEGDNWEGVSLLRPAYKHWFIKDKIERLDAIAQEREATGIPVVYPPANADDKVLDGVEEALAGLKAGEEAYIVMPGPHAEDLEDGASGWRLDVLGLAGGSASSGGGTRDPSKSLSYHSDKIAAAVVAEFMRLGQAGEGARATADVQQDPFYAGVEALAGTVEGRLNEVIARMIAFNFADAEGAPKLKMEEADSTSLGELKDFCQGLISSGALQADPELEDYLRDRAGLPPANAEIREQRQAQAEEDRELQVQGQKATLEDGTGEEDAPPGKPANSSNLEDSKKARRFARQDRELRDWEKGMALDDIEAAIDGARDSLEMATGNVLRAHAREIASAVASGKKPKVDATELEYAIHGELVALYYRGRATVRAELDAQRRGEPLEGFSTASGDVILLAEGQEAPKSLRRRARLMADSLVSRVVQAVTRLALAGRDDEADLQITAETEALAGLRAEAQLHAAPALNAGRADEADDQADDIKGSRYTSILDGNRCEQCASADDDVLRPLGDPVRLRRRPPNPDCYGGSRCRCMEAFELREEAAP